MQNLNKKLKKYLTLSPSVAEIAKPLESLGIIGFFYIRLYDNGEFADLASRPNWSEHYLRNLFQSRYQTQAMDDHLFIEEGISLWELNPHNIIWQEGKEIFGYGNGISIAENKANYKEVYCFYSTKENHAINHFYLNHIDYLKRFKAYFTEKAEKLISDSEKNRFILPDYISPPKTETAVLPDLPLTASEKKFQIQLNPLSQREKDCLHWLAQGKSAKETGALLHLSSRTVENYLANIKSKLDCKKTSELIYQALKLKLI